MQCHLCSELCPAAKVFQLLILIRSVSVYTFLNVLFYNIMSILGISTFGVEFSSHASRVGL